MSVHSVQRLGARWPAVWRLAAGAAVVWLGAACAVKAPPNAEELKATALAPVKVPAAWSAAGEAVGPVAGHWPASFGDAALTALVQEALANNPDLKQSVARVEQAQAYTRVAGGALYPAVDAMARGGGKLSGDNSGLMGGALTVSWELDLWARVRYGRAAATAAYESAAADVEYGRQSLAALVARSWFTAVEAGLQAGLAADAVRAADELVRLADVRAKVGVGTLEDAAAARADAARYRDAVRGLQQSREQALRALELVVGRYPSAEVAVATALSALPPAVPAGLPSELLERRPDVRAAERRVAAAFYRVGEAKAARLPRIGLTAGVSAISSDLFVLKERDNPVWSAGANLLAPVFEGGRLKAQVDVRSAEQREALAQYAAVGLRAFGEVENALSAEFAARERETLLAGAVADSARALELARVQFTVGRSDLRAVQQRLLALTSSRSSHLRMQAEQLLQRVGVHLALGGGFEPPPAAATTPAPATASTR